MNKANDKIEPVTVALVFAVGIPIVAGILGERK